MQCDRYLHIILCNALCDVNMECCIHVCSSAKSELKLFSSTSWTKFVECAGRWKGLSGIYAEKASVAWVSLALDENSTLKDDVRQRFGYHRECYQRFTDVLKLQSAVRVHDARQLQQAQEKLPSTSSYEGKSQSLMLINITIINYV